MRIATFEADITLYTHWVNPQNRKEDAWLRVPMRGVSFYGSQAVAVSGNGLATADQYTVRIPESAMPAGYCPPDVFRQAASPSGWTVQNGDVIVGGIVADEVQTGITDITRKYDSCFTVTSVSDNRRGLPAMRHLKIEGK